MYTLKLLVILLLLFSKQIEATRKIFAGETAPDTKAIPFLVKLSVYMQERVPGKSGNVGSCGGSYIRPNWVLSATHCIKTFFPLKNHKPKFAVLMCMGSVEAEPEKCPEPQKRLADEIYPHTEGEKYAEHDICLFKISKPWALGPTIKIAKFPEAGKDRKSYHKKKCLIAGWGLTNIAEMGGPLKQGTVIVYVDQPDKCQVRNDRQICVKGGSGITCQGDSGGPLSCDGELVGVLRGGFGKCNSTETKTSYFNMVEAYRDWIVSIAGGGANSIVPNKLWLCVFSFIPLAIFN